MKPAALLALLLLLAGGCRQKDEREVNPAAEWRDAVCACKDLPCATKAGEEIAKRYPLATTDRLDSTSIGEATACLEKLARADRPAADDTSADALIAAARAWQKDTRSCAR